MTDSLGSDNMHLCTSVNEERGGGESTVSETICLLSYTLRSVRLTDLVRHGESSVSETLSLMSSTRNNETIYGFRCDERLKN
jgi:hypothetical protein